MVQTSVWPAGLFSTMQPLLPIYSSSNPHGLLSGLRGDDYTQPLVDTSPTKTDAADLSPFEQQCRYCHVVSATPALSSSNKRALIAPCRCSGSVQFVHTACLTRWIEVSSRKLYPIPSCELCGYKYRRRPFIDLTHLHLPYIECCDRILNLLFLLLICIMVLCGWVAVHYLRLADKRSIIRPSRNSKRFLTENDVTVIIASILFFVAFFIALFTQYRAEVTIFRVLARIWTTNRNWRIRNYQLNEDSSRMAEEQADLKSIPKLVNSLT